MTSWTFVVPGAPVPQGSLRAFARGKRAFVVADNKPAVRDFRARVALAAQAAGVRPLAGAVVVVATFILLRPRGHFGARGLLPSAPLHPLTRPDVDKLARALLDALTGIAFADDWQVVELRAYKRYAAPGEGATTNVHLEGV